jgi:hypothetical protein
VRGYPWGFRSGAILANDNRIVRVNRSLSLRAVARCAMSLALSHQPSVLSPASCIITGRRFSFISRHGGPRHQNFHAREIGREGAM